MGQIIFQHFLRSLKSLILHTHIIDVSNESEALYNIFNHEL